MKKLWWILPVALLVTGSLLLAGCGGKKKTPPPDTDNLTKVALGTTFNIWGGAKQGDGKAQLGWATDGRVFDDDSEEAKAANGGVAKVTTVEAKGYKLDDFQKAKYLVLKLKSGQPAGGVQLIWGGNGATDAESKLIGGWHQAPVTSDSGVPNATSTKDGDELTIDLPKAFKDQDYGKYIDSKTTAVSLIIGYFTGNGIEDLFEDAWLLVADEKPAEEPEDPPVEVADTYVVLNGTDGLTTNGTISVGTLSGKKITATAGTHASGGVEYQIQIDFSTAVDIALTKFTHLVVEFEGVCSDDDFKQVGSFMPGFITSTKVMAQIQGIKSRTIEYKLGTELKGWGGSDDWTDATPVEKLELVINAIDAGDDWHKLPLDDASDIEFTVIKFEKRVEVNG